MTTVFHSGHKTMQPAHLGAAARPGETFPCSPSEFESFVLGQYRFLECLGSGGMGQVFRAEHQLMARQVAIKVMSPELVHDAESCARFRQEVRLVAQLCHPHIVLAYDADEQQGVHFFVMEYVDGADLGHIVAEFGPLPIPFACECIRQTALGLQHAHEHGLVHCDIKPSNLLLRDGMTSVYNFLGRLPKEKPGERPLIKILDFGLARLAGKIHGADSLPGSPEPGLFGTPDYMAPELGRDSTTVDIRCDLYSLGCTFSFLLTAQVPYPGGSWAEKLIRHHYDPATPICNMRPDVPAAIAEVINRLMAKDPVDRFSTPGEVAAAIQAWQETDDLATRSATPRRGEPWLGRGTPNRASLPDDRALAPMVATGNADRIDRTLSKLPLRLAWTIAACVAIACGFGLAWLACTPLFGKAVRTFEVWTKNANGEAVFRIDRDGTICSGLDQAVAAAEDGDTIIVQGNGPFILPGISCRGKSLTIKADAGFQPRFDFVPAPKDLPWRPLFFADRPLTLEGIHLHGGGEKAATAGPAVVHLIYVQGSPLKLVGCKLTAMNAQALIVGRSAPVIEIQYCTVSANASALCLEIGEHGPSKVSLQRSRFEVRDPDAAVAVLWANYRVSGRCQLDLDENEFVGGRLLALNGLDRAVSIGATKNSFHFRQSLLSVNSTDSSQALAGLIHWNGSRNRFGASSRWITSNCLTPAVGNLEEWKKCWTSSEIGSLEESPVAFSASPHIQ